MKSAHLIQKLLRAEQWIKNLFLFAALIFARKFNDTEALFLSMAGFLVFCLVSSNIYIINDILDRKSDREHPEKSKRPVASGAISLKHAWISAFLLSAAWFICARILSDSFLLICAIYAVINLLYSLWLKHIVILDTFIIAAGFILRILAGAILLSVEASTWLIVCTSSLALFLAFCKRRHELSVIPANSSLHRKVLKHYNLKFLDQMISITTASTIMSYTLYTVSEITIEKFGSGKLALTVPFVIYGIFRYLYIVYVKEEGGDPARCILKDIPSIVNLICWAAAAIVIIYFFPGV